MATSKYQGLSESYLKQAGSAYGSLLSDSARAGSTGEGGGSVASDGGYVKPDIPTAWKPDYASQYGADAALNAAQARETLQRGQTRMGINPNSGRFAGLNQAFELSAAAAKSGAKSKGTREANEDFFKNIMQTAGLEASTAAAASQATLGAAAQNLNAASTGASLAGQAGQGMAGLAGQYGDIASQAAEAEAAKKSELQESFDAMRSKNSAFMQTLESPDRSGAGKGRYYFGGGLSGVA